MIATITGILRRVLTALGLLAAASTDTSGALLAAAVVALAVTMLLVALMASSAHRSRSGSAAHPTRRSELFAPLTQSDPDAAGHVRRRGPSQVPAAV